MASVFKARLFERRMENTAAASVDETIEPNSILNAKVGNEPYKSSKCNSSK
ncbi:MAG: hypothetical protein H0V01_07645 [Bacteroidetes bacterium]|nr:hypothetical protein [Bacteroidota bacterium]